MSLRQYIVPLDFSPAQCLASALLLHYQKIPLELSFSKNWLTPRSYELSENLRYAQTLN